MGMPSEPRVVVTGAASGLGRALVLEAAKRKARVLAADIDEGGARETVRLALERGAREGLPFRCDVGRAEDVEALAARADEAFGGTDLVVNNAGVAAAGNVGDIALADWEWVLRVNLWGVIHGCHAFVPRFRRQGTGHVLNVASAAGLVSAPQMGAYNATKAAVVALSETLRAELAETAVGVTVLCPMFFSTNIGRSARFTHPAQLDAIEREFARAKLTANDVAAVALASVDANELYCVPMAQGRWLWRMKRASPAGFGALLRLAMKAGLLERAAER